MYWYISFLRPPPISAEAGSSITITPQVANDLRTELRYEPTDLSYHWRRSTPSVIHTPVVHLTTFSPPDSTYRPLSIPLPEKAQIGERWQLCLSATASSLVTDGRESGWQDILALTGPSSSCIPLSVYSEGIEIIRPNPASGSGVTKGIGAKSKGKSKERGEDREKVGKKGKERDEGVKQSRIMREWGIPGVIPLRLVEQTSFDLDKKVWDSGLALSSWLYRHLDEKGAGIPTPGSLGGEAQALAAEVLDSLRQARESHNILELGSGTGLVSIALCSILSQRSSTGGRIVATDLESAIELMRENMALNRLISDTAPDDADFSLTADVLDWDQPLPPWVSQGHEGQDSWPDLIIAADVTYNTASFPSLIRTLKSLLLPPGRTQRPKLLLAYKQRDPGERELWGMLEMEGVQMVLVDTIAGAEEEGAVEIWISGLYITA